MFSLIQRVKSFSDLPRTDSEPDFVGKVTEAEMKRVASNPDMDPSVEPNKNISWVRGEALIAFYVGVLFFVRILLLLLSVEPSLAWTILNVAHCLVIYFFWC